MRRGLRRRSASSEIVVPPNPSVGSAVGFLFAPVSYESRPQPPCAHQGVPFCRRSTGLLTRLWRGTPAAVVRAGAPQARRRRSKRTAFMRYSGQGHEIEVDIPDGQMRSTRTTSRPSSSAFEAEYRAPVRPRRAGDGRSRSMNWSVVVSTRPQPPAADRRLARPRSSAVSAGLRRAEPCFDRPEPRRRFTAAVHKRRGPERPAMRIAGPALIVEPQTTTFVSARLSSARIDPAGNIVMTRRAASNAEDAADAATRRAVALSEIELQVMWDRLMAIVEEQGQVLMRAAFSPIVRECGDISAGIFDRRRAACWRRPLPGRPATSTPWPRR